MKKGVCVRVCGCVCVRARAWVCAWVCVSVVGPWCDTRWMRLQFKGGLFDGGKITDVSKRVEHAESIRQSISTALAVRASVGGVTNGGNLEVSAPRSRLEQLKTGKPSVSAKYSEGQSLSAHDSAHASMMGAIEIMGAIPRRS